MAIVQFAAAQALMELSTSSRRPSSCASERGGTPDGALASLVSKTLTNLLFSAGGSAASPARSDHGPEALEAAESPEAPATARPKNLDDHEEVEVK